MSAVASRVAFPVARDGYEAALDACVHTSWGQLAARFTSAIGHPSRAATPFQRGGWLQAWYDTVGAQVGTQAVPLEIRDADTGRPIFGVPLIKRVYEGQVVVEFADAGLTDYNAPLIGDGWAAGRQGDHSGGQNEGVVVTPDALLDLLREHLPDCDQLQFRKMPATLGGAANPFAYLSGARTSDVGTNVVTIDGSWSDYRARLAKKVRKELERSFRVFERDGTQARFQVVSDAAEAVAILERMEVLQEERMRELQLPFILNEPQYSAFYRRLIELDLSNGRLLLTVLKSEPDEVVGALLGLVDGDSYAMVRLAHAGKAWSHCSPGKLMIDQTMQHLHATGVTRFDFTTGDYSYKRGFLTESEPLVEVSLGLSLEGKLKLARLSAVSEAKDQMRRFPRAFEWLKRLVG